MKKRFGVKRIQGKIVSYGEEDELYIIQYDNGDREKMNEEGALLYLIGDDDYVVQVISF